MVDFGTDINSDGRLSSNGQISLISDRDNLIQAIKNRIRTYKGTYSFIDSNYGTLIKEMVGYDNTDVNRQILCLDVETNVLQDKRIAKTGCNYNNGYYDLKVITVDNDEIILEDVII